MRIGEYLQIGEKLKTTRKSHNITQRKMAENLNLSFSTYSNYENGYSEPQMEVIESFCSILNLTVSDLFGMSVTTNQKPKIETFADFLRAVIELDLLGVPVDSEVKYNNDNNELSAIPKLDINNPQIASFIPDWKKAKNDFYSGYLSKYDYNKWLNNSLKIFDIPIKELIQSTGGIK